MGSSAEKWGFIFLVFENLNKLLRNGSNGLMVGADVGSTLDGGFRV